MPLWNCASRSNARTVPGESSISVGCASVQPSPNLACYSLLQTADEQLYLARHSGRDCVR